MRVAIAALLVLYAAGAAAVPRAKSAEECMIYADLALVASTFAKHGIARDQAERMLPDMYEIGTPDAVEIAQRIVESAYELLRVEPKMFSRALVNTCVSRGGAMDAILGVKL